MSSIKKDIVSILNKYPDTRTIKVKVDISPSEWQSFVSVISCSRSTKKAVTDLYSELKNMHAVEYSCGTLTIRECHESAAKEIAQYISQYLTDIGYKVECTTFVDI